MQLTHLGPYVIEKPLGKGGMGSVYAATDPQTGQRVAIKALSPHLASAEGFRERFEAEIESLKTLRHEGIVRLYGYGEQDGVLFYSMEVVDGISLEDELRAGRRFNWREVTHIAIQLSLALKHAHDHGIVHRDIKPANILLYGDEKVKLADFGIARLFGTTSLTTAGGVLGTADYMSPEQADGRPVTARCDQYSLGGVMYALLAGRPPFRAKNLPQMLQLQRFASPEPVRRYAPDTPEQLESVIAQLLLKDPADRFPNTQVLARHLQAMLNALTRPAADDFALAGEHPPIARQFASLHESLAADVTQAEVIPPKPTRGGTGFGDSKRTNVPLTSQIAATMAADDSASRSAATSLAPEPTRVPPATVKPPEPVSRFTTIEEEERRQRLQNQRSWLTVLAQVVGMAAVLAALAGAAIYISRPPTADKLYGLISTRVEGSDDAGLAKAEGEIDDFLKRYPDDSRSDEFRAYKERIELYNLDRKLQRQGRGATAGKSLLPAEQLYLQAASEIGNSPEKALSTFQSLVDLYGPNSIEATTSESNSATKHSRQDRDDAERTASIVQLAKRRMDKLRVDLAILREQQLKALEERLTAAGQLAGKSPEQAAAMYRAIISLNEGNAWAAAAVEKARTALSEIKK